MQFIDLKSQQEQRLPDGRSLREGIEAGIAAVLNHGQYILGPEVAELEDRLAAFVGVEHCITVASGTDALLIALMALGVRAGDEVITTPFSFIATSETIALLGATPVYVDIDARTYNLNPLEIEAAITPRTKAIIPVSLYGQPADLPAINLIAERHGIPVVEDGAQSFGAELYGRRSCGMSKVGTTSFFPSKPLGGYGDGGACFTNDRQLADKIRRISIHGQSSRYFHVELGVNGRLDTIQAAILLVKMNLFDDEVIRRQQVGLRYTQRLNEIGIYSTPQILEGATSVYAQYTIEVENRKNLQEALNASGIPTAVHYPTLLCQQPALRCCVDRCQNGCSTPVAQQVSERVLSLPMHPYLKPYEQDQVIAALAAAVG